MHVCLAPDNGLKSDVSARVFRAISGLMRCSKFMRQSRAHRYLPLERYEDAREPQLLR
jgi:hypothetical protein